MITAAKKPRRSTSPSTRGGSAVETWIPTAVASPSAPRAQSIGGPWLVSKSLLAESSSLMNEVAGSSVTSASTVSWSNVEEWDQALLHQGNTNHCFLYALMMTLTNQNERDVVSIECILDYLMRVPDYKGDRSTTMGVVGRHVSLALTWMKRDGLLKQFHFKNLTKDRTLHIGHLLDVQPWMLNYCFIAVGYSTSDKETRKKHCDAVMARATAEWEDYLAVHPSGVQNYQSRMWASIGRAYALKSPRSHSRYELDSIYKFYPKSEKGMISSAVLHEDDVEVLFPDKKVSCTKQYPKTHFLYMPEESQQHAICLRFGICNNTAEKYGDLYGKVCLHIADPGKKKLRPLNPANHADTLLMMMESLVSIFGIYQVRIEM